VVFHPLRCDLTVCEDQYCALSKGWNGGDGQYRHGMLLLKCSKDRILRVDTPGQHVPPRVRYGMAHLLIRNTIGSVSCSVQWGLAW
jgi:hypothetical protein